MLPSWVYPPPCPPTHKPPSFLTSCPDHVLSFLIFASSADPHPLKPMTGTNSLRNGTDEPVCRAEIETQMSRADLWPWGWWGRRGGDELRVALADLQPSREMTSRKLLYSPGSSAQGSVMTWTVEWGAEVGRKSKRDGMCLLLFSHPVVSDSVTPWTAACQASLSLPSPKVCPSSCPLHQI